MKNEERVDCKACEQAERIIKKVAPGIKEMADSGREEGEQTFDDITNTMLIVEVAHLKEWHCECKEQAVSAEELLSSIGVEAEREVISS